MKKLITICLLIATTIIANAQTKPTKEETVQFIKDYYVNQRMDTGIYGFKDSDNQLHSLSNSIDNIDIQFDEKSNQISISYDRLFLSIIYTDIGKLGGRNYSKEKYIIDLSKVQLISLSPNLLTDKKMYLVDLVFIATSDYKIKSFISRQEKNEEMAKLPNTPEMVDNVRIIINFYQTTDQNFDHKKHNEQIYKAFNYLRKLCGAPEPPQPKKQLDFGN